MLKEREKILKKALSLYLKKDCGSGTYYNFKWNAWTCYTDGYAVGMIPGDSVLWVDDYDHPGLGSGFDSDKTLAETLEKDGVAWDGTLYRTSDGREYIKIMSASSSLGFVPVVKKLLEGWFGSADRLQFVPGDEKSFVYVFGSCGFLGMILPFRL